MMTGMLMASSYSRGMSSYAMIVLVMDLVSTLKNGRLKAGTGKNVVLQ